MTKKKENTDVTVLSSTEVAVIPSKEELQAGMRKTLKDLDKKLEKLSVPPNYTYKVGAINLYGNGWAVSVSISASTDVNQLIMIWNQVQKAKIEHENAIKTLKLSTSAFCSIGGYAANDVIKDVENRLKQVTNTQAIANIKAAKTKLEAFLSEDDRLIKTLSEVEDLLK